MPCPTCGQPLSACACGSGGERTLEDMSIPVLRPPGAADPEATLVEMNMPVLRPPGQQVTAPEPDLGGERTVVEMDMPVLAIPRPELAPPPAQPAPPPQPAPLALAPPPERPSGRMEIAEFDLDGESTATLEASAEELGLAPPEAEEPAFEFDAGDDRAQDAEFTVRRSDSSGAMLKLVVLYLIGALVAVGALMLAITVVRDGLAK